MNEEWLENATIEDLIKLKAKIEECINKKQAQVDHKIEGETIIKLFEVLDEWMEEDEYCT